MRRCTPVINRTKFAYLYALLKLQEEVERCKSTYDALNSQLLEELPTFLDLGMGMHVVAIKEFISLRRRFVGRVTKELLSLMDVSNTKLIVYPY